MNFISEIMKYPKKDDNHFTIELFALISWIFLTAFLPLIAGAIGTHQFVCYVVYILASYLLGIFIVQKITIIQQIPNLLKTGIQIFSGATFNSILFIFIGEFSILICLIYVLLILFLQYKKIIINKNIFYEVLVLIPIFFIMLSPEEYSLTTKLHLGMSWDYTFYTSIVESLKINQDFSNSIIHNGIPINYPAFPFTIPAHIASICSIPSQIALWGIFMPFLYFLAIQTTSWLIYKLYCKIFNKTESDFLNKSSIINVMLIFWGPLHILNLAKGNINEVLFLGLGYLIPGGSPGYTISIFLGSLLLLIYFFNQHKNWQDALSIILILIYIAGSKIAFALPLITFIGLFSLITAYKEKSTRGLIPIFLGGLLSLFTIYLFTFSFESKIHSYFGTDGFIINELISFGQKYHLPPTPLILTISLAIGLRLFYFLGIKSLITIPVIKNSNQKLFVSNIFLSLILTLLAFFPIYLFYNTTYLNLDNTRYRDGSFDTQQFIRSIVFIINIFFICFTLFYFDNLTKSSKIMSRLILVWISICLFSFVSQNFLITRATPTPEKTWYTEVIEDYNKVKPKTLIMLSDGKFSGLGLTSLGIHPWYIFGSTKMRDCYSNDVQSLTRRKYLEDLLTPSISKESRRNIAKYFINNSVDCIVENPFSKNKIQSAFRDSLIEQIPGTKHLYRFTFH